jgi:polysaccharide pyruvyl transferase WcaK-like protein
VANILVCGAFPGTRNLGVNALGTAFISAYSELRPEDNIYLQTLDGKISPVELPGTDVPIEVTGVSIRPSKNFFRRDTTIRIKVESGLSLGNRFSEIFRKIDVVVDVAGGDSFTDLYGIGRFDMVNAVKDLCLKYGKKYICLPQTYGPFVSEAIELRAKRYVQESLCSWARDDQSYKVLLDLAGHKNDAKYRNGVDMAFLLPVKNAEERVDAIIVDALQGNEGVIGINVSGLIYNSPEDAKNRYKFLCDYQSLILDFVKRVLDETSFTVLLVPHVLADPSSVESDFAACQDVVSRLGSNKRILVQSPCLDECESKWLISQCNWFMGTRMHATIAGLSTCTPTCTVSYSDKAYGVFDSCGLADQVFDPRMNTKDDILSLLMESLSIRESLSGRLKEKIPQVVLRARAQIRDIATIIEKV